MCYDKKYEEYKVNIDKLYRSNHKTFVTVYIASLAYNPNNNKTIVLNAVKLFIRYTIVFIFYLSFYSSYF